MIARATEVQKRWWGGFENAPEKLAVAASKLADNLKRCSCFFCCNRRRRVWDETRTRQEMRRDLGLREETEVE